MTPEEYKHARPNFWKQFTYGAVLGAFSGVSLALQFSPSFITGLWIFLAAVGVCALAAGFLGDRFWAAIFRVWDWKGRR
jgi:hypothetical protein